MPSEISVVNFNMWELSFRGEYGSISHDSMVANISYEYSLVVRAFPFFAPISDKVTP